MWQERHNEVVWVNKEAIMGPVLFDMVGRIDEDKLQMGRMGNYKYDMNNMLAATWSFQLEEPTDTVFDADYRHGVSVLNRLQSLGPYSGRNKGIIIGGESAAKICFSAPLFVKKGSAITDEPTIRWPMGYGSAARFELAQETHSFEPLKVTTRIGVSIPSTEWETSLSGALVQVTFTIHRSLSGSSRCDVFNAKPRKIKVIKPREEKRPNKPKVVKSATKVPFGPMDTWVKGGSNAASRLDIVDPEAN